MSISTFSSKTYNLGDLLNLIKLGNIALPDLQRPYVWEQSKARDLFDSLFKGLPVGYILLWEIDSSVSHHTIGTEAKKLDPRFLVIDGQQRLTSLYAVIYGMKIKDKTFKERNIAVSFNPLTGEFEISNAAIARNHDWIPNISELFGADSEYHFTSDYLQRLGEKREVCKADEIKISDNISRLKSILNYDLSVLELMPDLEPDLVADIFVRINSKGVELKQSDFILTLMSVHWKAGREELGDFCEAAKTIPEFESSSPFNYLIKPQPEHIVRTAIGYAFLRGRMRYAYLILQGKDLESHEISEGLRLKNLAQFQEAQSIALDLTNWHDFIRIIQTTGFANDGMLTSKTAFFVTYSFYLLGKLKFKVPHKNLESIIRRWFLFSILTSRYTGSPESAIEQDLVNFRDSSADFVTILAEIIDTSLTNDYWNITLPQALVSSSSLNNVYVCYLAAQNILDMYVPFSESKLRQVLQEVNELKHKKVPIDKHHLFPKAYLERNGITSVTEQNQVANYIYLEYKDNIQISDNPPTEYWSELISGYETNKVRQIMEENAIPENFPEMEYGEFLTARRKLMAQKIKDAFSRL